MSIATAIQNAQNKVADVYNAIGARGGTLPATQDLSNMPTAVNSIPSGGEDNNYGVSGFYMVDNGVAKQQLVDVSNAFTSITSIDTNGMNNAFSNSPFITGDANFHSCTQVNTNGLQYAFYNCKNLNGSINFSSLTYAATNSFSDSFEASNISGDISFPNLTFVGSNSFAYAFYSCHKLTNSNLTFQALSTITQPFVFQGICLGSSLNSASFPALTTINGDNAFYSARLNANEVFFPELVSITSNGVFNNAFNSCTQLKSISFPKLETISGSSCFQYAFNGCSNLTSISFNSLTNVSYGTFPWAFSSTKLSEVNSSLFPNLVDFPSSSNMFAYCGSITKVDMPHMTSIGINNPDSAFLDNAFYQCKNLTDVYFNNVITVGVQACKGFCNNCFSLRNVGFPNLTTIYTKGFLTAFMRCNHLTSVDFSNLSNIAASEVFGSAFRYCTNLTTINFPSLTPSSFGSYTNQFINMFKDCTGVTVHFPSTVQNIIEGMSTYPSFGGTNTTVLFDL